MIAGTSKPPLLASPPSGGEEHDDDAPAGLERFIIESGIADPPDEAQSRQAAVRSAEEAHGLMTAAPACGVRYTALEKP